MEVAQFKIEYENFSTRIARDFNCDLVQSGWVKDNELNSIFCKIERNTRNLAFYNLLSNTKLLFRTITFMIFFITFILLCNTKEMYLYKGIASFYACLFAYYLYFVQNYKKRSFQYFLSNLLDTLQVINKDVLKSKGLVIIFNIRLELFEIYVETAENMKLVDQNSDCINKIVKTKKN